MSRQEIKTPPFFESHISWICISLITALLFIWAHHTVFLNSYILNDDVRQQLFWMQRWLDPELYPQDLLGHYSQLYVPWGVQGLYYLVSSIIPPLLFSKILPGILYTFMGTLVFFTGRRIGGWALGLTCVAAFWFMPFFLHYMAGGLARAFAGPLLMFFLYGWVSRSRWLVAIALVAQSLFIPYIFVLCTGAAGLAWLGWKCKITEEPPFLSCMMDLVILGCACGLLLGWHMQMSAAGFGPLPWASEIMNQPEFSALGRFHIIPVPSIFHELIIRPWESLAPFKTSFDKLGIFWLCTLIPFIVVFIFKAPWCLWKQHAVPVVCLIVASILLYVSARMVLLKLFLPSRYMEYSVNIGYCFVLGMCLFGMIEQKGKIPFCRALVVVSIVAFLGAFRLSGEGMHDYSRDQEICEYLKVNTTKDVLVAGHPYQMDNILTFSQRNVFASYELAHPWNQGYWARLKPRLLELFEAYYAGDVSEVTAFCIRNEIDYIVVDPRFFTKEFIETTPFFAPFDTLIREKVQDVKRFALLSDNMPVQVVGNNVRVISVNDLVKATVPQ